MSDTFTNDACYAKSDRRLTMILSDVRRREPKPLYLSHSTLLVLNKSATRRSNRLLADLTTALGTGHSGRQCHKAFRPHRTGKKARLRLRTSTTPL
jgi:hypothetical protein